MSSWYNGGRSYSAGGQNNDGATQDGYGGAQYEATTGGKKRGSSRLKKSGGGGSSSKKDADAADADDGYPKYAANNENGTKDEATDEDNRNGHYSGHDYGGGAGNPYSGGIVIGAPYYGSGGGYGYGGNNSASSYGYGGNNSASSYGNGGNNSASSYGDGGNNSASSYGNGGGGGGYAPYNIPATYWAPPPQDGSRSPMIITTREVNVYGVPGAPPYDHNNHNNERRGGGERGFFGPALHAFGHFIDRRFGLSDRDD